MKTLPSLISTRRGFISSKLPRAPWIRCRLSSPVWPGLVKPRKIAICPRSMVMLGCSDEPVEISSTFDSDEIEQLWRSVSKPLMTIGKQGVQETHCTAFYDLISSHVLVKVKRSFQLTNEQVVETMLKDTKAQLIQTKGNVMLFLSGDAGTEDIKEWVQTQQLKREEKKSRREWNRQIKKTPPSGVILPKSVMSLLKSMEENRLICSITFDTRSKMLLSELSENDQLEVLGSLDRQKLKRVNNKSAWLTSQIKLYRKQS